MKPIPFESLQWTEPGGPPPSVGPILAAAGLLLLLLGAMLFI